MKWILYSLIWLGAGFLTLNATAQTEKQVRKAIHSTDTTQFNVWFYSGGLYINKMYKGLSLLHLAVLDQNPVMVDYFLFREAFVNIRNKKGVTPLMMALQLASDDICKKLLAHGALPNFADLNGHTSVYYAVIFGKYERVEMIVNAGGDPRIEDDFHKTPSNYTSDASILNMLNTFKP